MMNSRKRWEEEEEEEKRSSFYFFLKSSQAIHYFFFSNQWLRLEWFTFVRDKRCRHLPNRTRLEQQCTEFYRVFNSMLFGVEFVVRLGVSFSFDGSSLPLWIQDFVGLSLYRATSLIPSVYRVLPGFTGFYWVLLGFTGFYRVLLGFHPLASEPFMQPSFVCLFFTTHSVLLIELCFIVVYLVLPSFTQFSLFYLVLPSLTKFDEALLNYTQFHHELPSFTYLFLFLPSFTQFYLVLPIFTQC